MLGSLILYLKGMRRMRFQLFGFRDIPFRVSASRAFGLGLGLFWAYAKQLNPAPFKLNPESYYYPPSAAAILKTYARKHNTKPYIPGHPKIPNLVL